MGVKTLSVLDVLHSAGVDITRRDALVDYVRLSGLPYDQRLSLLERIERETEGVFTADQWIAIA